MPATHGVAGAAAGNNAASAAVTVTIPDASNIVALCFIYYLDATITGLTCSQGGTTVSAALYNTAPWRVHRVTGLAAGSVTFTPTGSGGGDVSMAVVVGVGVNPTTPNTTPVAVTFPNTLDTNFVDQASTADSLAILTVNGSPTNSPYSWEPPVTSRADAETSGYGRAINAATAAGTGAAIRFETGGTEVSINNPGIFAELLPAASNATLTVDAQPTTGTTDVALGTFTIESSDTGSTATVTATKASGPGNIGGTTSLAMVAGSVDFSAIEFDAPGTYTVAFNATGHDEVISASIVVSDPVPASTPAMGRWRLMGPR